jgi:hypothetical protein
MSQSTIQFSREETADGQCTGGRSTGARSTSRVLGQSFGAALRSVSHCRVCGFSEVRTDEVVDRGRVLLAECPRCEHRWTSPAGGPYVVRPRERSVGEVASAA